MSIILSSISAFIIHTISSMGYGGVVLLMGVGAFNIPIPSEVIMPFSGYLVSTGQFNLFLVALCATAGWMVGAIASYYLGIYGGRPLFLRYGKYLLISHRDLDHTEKLFDRFGIAMVFVGQLLPVVRNFISIVAGITEVKIGRFLVFTAAGAFIWSYILAWIGFRLGANWENLRGYFHRFDIAIVVLIVVGIVFWVYRHLKNSRT